MPGPQRSHRRGDQTGLLETAIAGTAIEIEHRSGRSDAIEERRGYRKQHDLGRHRRGDNRDDAVKARRRRDCSTSRARGGSTSSTIAPVAPTVSRKPGVRDDLRRSAIMAAPAAASALSGAGTKIDDAEQQIADGHGRRSRHRGATANDATVEREEDRHERLSLLRLAAERATSGPAA